MQTIGREHKVFSYSAEHESVAKIAPGESVLIETTYAFGDQPLEPGDSLADIDLARWAMLRSRSPRRRRTRGRGSSTAEVPLVVE